MFFVEGPEGIGNDPVGMFSPAWNLGYMSKLQEGSGRAIEGLSGSAPTWLKNAGLGFI